MLEKNSVLTVIYGVSGDGDGTIGKTALIGKSIGKSGYRRDLGQPGGFRQ
ncbi:MAG: hypothetical protein H8E39_10285 [Alphaproteobacteria bacterium]|nr:hypothetical protein [Alphaproteobacteria bacterium]